MDENCSAERSATWGGDKTSRVRGFARTKTAARRGARPGGGIGRELQRGEEGDLEEEFMCP